MNGGEDILKRVSYEDNPLFILINKKPTVLVGGF
jgi:hypothetical protein